MQLGPSVEGAFQGTLVLKKPMPRDLVCTSVNGSEDHINSREAQMPRLLLEPALAGALQQQYRWRFAHLLCRNCWEPKD